MSIIQELKDRRAIRNYEEQEVEDEKIKQLRVGKGSCNGTFGELVQGVLGERPFCATGSRIECGRFPHPFFSLSRQRRHCGETTG
ncbi:hypothetical protein J2S21_000001, partial [Peribacillus cavernae]|nr:hypothetical protein [Peribacillus cavernae]